jgi:hypothetical protein
MAYHIKVGTILDAGGREDYDYVIERITRTAEGTVATVQARTIMQRIFPGTVATTWTATELLALLNKGTLSIVPPR